jgi:hypothetical protein
MRRKAATRANPPAAGPPAPPAHPALAALGRSRWLYVPVSLLLLIPCYWQPRIEAGDLSSHVYNSWLAQLIGSGRAQGLAVVWQSTNILFDLLLSGLFQTLGPEAAQRISVSLAVLVFSWGAFAFAAAVSGRRPWPVMPCIAMLAYGWVYHMGFFNFYLSLGLCFWALALLWKPSPRGVPAAIPILALAYLAHAFPVAWAVCLWAYRVLAGRLSPKGRAYLLGGSLVAMLALHKILSAIMATQWFPQQIASVSGLDQLWVFDAKYKLAAVALLLLWGAMFINLVRTGIRQMISGVAFQFCLIGAAGIFILPDTVLPPGYLHALGFIGERMSLAVAVCVCALLAAARPSRFERYAMVFVALVFFGFLYHDERALNSFEGRMQDAVAHLPPGQRVISAITQDPNDSNLRVNGLAHMIDRVCIGHCYSYANYEPPTAQFRVRVNASNPYLLDFQDSFMMQMGAYVVKDRDLPLYQLDLDASGRMVVKSLPAGTRCESTAVDVLGDLL